MRLTKSSSRSKGSRSELIRTRISSNITLLTKTMSINLVYYWARSQQIQICVKISEKFGQVLSISTNSCSRKQISRTSALSSTSRRTRRIWISRSAILDSSWRTSTCLVRSSMNGNNRCNSQPLIQISTTIWTSRVP